MSSLESVSHLNPEAIHFSVFSKSQLEKLFVKRIHSPLTFDNFGHPFPGGLYDKDLGPCTKAETCGTCLQFASQCPGHFGYIQLPLPVINALFFRTIVDVLKFTCFECFRLQAPPNFKTCLLVQVHLLDRGLVCEALELDALCRHLWDDKNKKKDISGEIYQHVERYRELINVTSPSANNTKNVETFRRELISLKNLMSFMKRKSKECMYCNASTKPVKSLRNKIFVGDSIKTPESLKQYLRAIWTNDSEFLQIIVPFLRNVDSEHPTDLMFFENVPVTPPINRPVNILQGKILENEQTQVYKEIIETTVLLQHAVRVINSNDDSTILSEEAMRMYNLLEGATSIEKLNNLWELLQLRVDCLIDKPTILKNTGGRGLKQLLEKKQGLIRMHMMGKRVNFSARTVITPDPYISIEEIGIPLAFAKKVTIPVSVSHLNAAQLRTLILNGPDVHPGAVQVEFEDGNVIRLSAHNQIQRESIAKRLLTPHEKGFTGTKKVHRHVNNGDIALLNRQPTLHKPSIMGHTVRVLKSEKTLRLHYANCKPYNADFDGDEMNVHFPQNLVAQSEGYNLAKVPFQYLSVKDGSPLSGLIQDHVIAGVKLTTRGQFFTKSEYHQLVCQGLVYQTSEIKLLPPAIIKPQHLWSGKQVLSTVIINNLPPDRKLMNMVSKAKISARAWVNNRPRKWLAGGTEFTHENEMTETEIVIRGGELLVGVLDKASFGTSSYGLIHRIYELYGGTYSSKMLSSFSTLFTSYLQHVGFTISVQDILVHSYADRKRNKIIRATQQMGKELICAALDDFHNLPLKEIAEKVSEARFRNPKMSAIIDSQYKQVLDKRTNEINKTCLPAGLKCRFPDNNLQLMVQSGAKGSTVNTMQMSCLLGQVELEGKRPPLMISGKSLPSFPTSDFSPRAGGFIEGRFMTGIQPQELFFHSMAGREGLIDTTVKTSRSGYLQRCFIKLLEDLVVQYDMTVRDASGCVIQFLYGEDGLDVTKAQFLNDKHIEFLNENADLIIDDELSKCEDKENSKKIKKHLEEINEFKEKHGTTLNKFRQTPFKLFSQLAKNAAVKKCNDPNKIDSQTGRSQLTEAILIMWSAFGEKEKLESRCKKCPDPVNSIMKPDVYPGSFSDKLNETLTNCTKNYKKKKAKKFANILKSKVIKSHCDPGEAVGILAAQSLGEPCTQMTLNTFHFAGRGDMNVTLGIPRIREILMEASIKIKTPNMTIPFLDIPDVELHAEKLRKRLTRVTVADVLVDIEVENELMVVPCRQWMYRLKFSFLPYELYKTKYNVKPKKILKYMKTHFCPTFIKGIIRSSSFDTNNVVLSVKKDDDKKKNKEREDEDNPSPEEREEKDEDDEQSEDDANEEYSDEEGSSNEDDDEENEGNNRIHRSDFEDDEEYVEEEKISKNQVDFIYKSDIKNHLWCSIEFTFDVSGKKVDLTAILRDLANKSIIFGTPNIKKAIVYKKDGVLTLVTEGCNIPEMFKYDDLLNLNKLVSNDIHKMAEIYGIEAATQVISKEVKDVFTPYSITVDKRHLSLVADFMTFSGAYTPLNRRGITDSASPVQKISFESCLKFLKEAIIGGKVDNLKNPSSCIMIGKPIRVGTGCFDLVNFSTSANVD